MRAIFLKSGEVRSPLPSASASDVLHLTERHSKQYPNLCQISFGIRNLYTEGQELLWENK